ncbi:MULTISPECIES: hypothetical protein [Clostridium]|jgi:hypothetical protein|uniref:hypothetical protein n=1 Tax=Clostridium TaxID=1485 RepID=UPI000E8E1DFB|nr:hypothetical protein [Clostridium tyrobutyricum]HBF76983.1 hypothetical protein [Clostridiaceae bacterium]
MLIESHKKLFNTLSIMLITIAILFGSIYEICICKAVINKHSIQNGNSIKYDRMNIDTRVYAQETTIAKSADGSVDPNASVPKDTSKKISKDDYVEAIERIEGGSSFEKIIAKVLANLLGSLMSIIGNVGHLQTLDGIVFNTGMWVDGYTPLEQSDWNNINSWYTAMSALSAVLLMIAILTIFVKFVKAAGNMQYRNEAINSLKRLFASPLIIMITPMIIHALLYINNNMVSAFYSFVSTKNISLDSTLGTTTVLDSLELSSPLAGVLILGLFAFLTIKINIIFIIRNFNIIVYTIFTPFAATLWIIDENINGAKVWLGELISNIFMQMSYAFLFSIYLSFMGGKTWLTQLIWGNLIVALADVLRNMFQGKLTELSGLNETRAASNMIASSMGTMAGVSALFGTANAFKAQVPHKQKSEDAGQAQSAAAQPAAGFSANNNSARHSARYGTPAAYARRNAAYVKRNADANTANINSADTTNTNSFVHRSINTGNKIATATSIASKVAKGTFEVAAMPIAAASGNPNIVRGVVDLGKNVDNGVQTISGPAGRAVGAGVEGTKIGVNKGAEKIKGTKAGQKTQEFVNRAKDHVPEKVKTTANDVGAATKNVGKKVGKGLGTAATNTAKVLSGKDEDIDNILKYR